MTDDLDDNWRDRLASGAKGAVSIVPLVGGPLGELVGEIIPGLRQDRVVQYLRSLAERVETLEEEKQQALFDDQERIDLVETGGHLAARATTSERIERIATIVFRGLSRDDVSIVRRKRLTQLLAQIDDDEMALLNAYGQTYGMSFDRTEKDPWDSINRPGPVHFGSTSDEFESSELFELGRDNLLRLGLIERKYQNVKKGEYPPFDAKSGGFKSRLEISYLGRMFLRELGIELPFKD